MAVVLVLRVLALPSSVYLSVTCVFHLSLLLYVSLPVLSAFGDFVPAPVFAGIVIFMEGSATDVTVVEDVISLPSLAVILYSTSIWFRQSQ